MVLVQTALGLQGFDVVHSLISFTKINKHSNNGDVQKHTNARASLKGEPLRAIAGIATRCIHTCGADKLPTVVNMKCTFINV